MRLLRTIQLDVSDTLVFEQAATPGEWAVTGSFLFMDENPSTLTGKRRAAFRQGFAGVQSLGFSTLAVVTPARQDDIIEATEHLARSLIEQLGAPDLETARLAAQEEILFSASLCMNGTEPYPEGTVIAMSRFEEAGAIREQFRSLARRESPALEHDWSSDARAFAIIEVDDTNEPEDRIDLVSLVRSEPSPE